jgi:hypothetical protein
MTSTTIKQFEKTKGAIIENMDSEFEDINEKLDNIEELIEKKLGEYNKKISDLYSLQNKVNDINKMNGQSIINQINQYDEGLDENEDMDKNAIFNSIENSNNIKTSMPQNDNSQNCFIKIKNITNDDKEMFYMSPINNKKNSEENRSNHHKSSNTDATSSKNKESSKNEEYLSEESSSESVNESATESNNSDNSTILELEDGIVKNSCVNNSPLANNMLKILNNDTPRIKKNNVSNDDFDNFGKPVSSDNDSPIIITEFIKTVTNNNKVIELN